MVVERQDQREDVEEKGNEEGKQAGARIEHEQVKDGP